MPHSRSGVPGRGIEISGFHQRRRYERSAGERGGTKGITPKGSTRIRVVGDSLGMKRSTRYFIGVVVSALTLSLNAADRPNVLLIYADDLGSVDLNCYGATDLVTPHLDSLAERGVRFTQFYSAAPVCSPSRAALLTGRYPQRAGVPGNVSSSAGHAGMPTSQTTLAELLAPAGYYTAHVGKWHLGYTPETRPNGQGFDYSFGHMGGCIDNYSHFFYWNGPNRHDLHRNGVEVFEDGRFFPDLMVEEIEAILEHRGQEPFFIYWAFNVPHYPYQGDEKWLRYYRDRLPYPRDLYAAFMSTLDERIGEVLRKLDALGLRDDTIIIFQSDNGHSEEERAHRGGGSAGPYRGQKFSLFEGGIRLPAIISWPNRLAQGETRDQLATACDWLPTLLDYCEVPLPSDLRLDGKSLRSVIKSPSAPSPHSAFHWESGGPRTKRQWAVRSGDWKLVANPRGGRVGESLFLSNLAKDFTETRNLAHEYPEMVEKLRSLHQDWQLEVTQN